MQKRRLFQIEELEAFKAKNILVIVFFLAAAHGTLALSYLLRPTFDLGLFTFYCAAAVAEASKISGGMKDNGDCIIWPTLAFVVLTYVVREIFFEPSQDRAFEESEGSANVQRSATG